MQKQQIEISTNIILRVLVVVAAAGFLFVIRDVIALFLIAIIITAALHPIIGKIVRVTKVPRTATVSMVYLLFFAGIAGLAAFVIPTISDEIDAFIGELTAYIGQNAFLSSLFSVDELAGRLTGSVENLASTTAGLFTGVVSSVAVVSMSFYMSIEEDGLKKSLLLITPEQHQKYISSLIERIQESFGRWMAGQLITMIFVGLMYYAVLSFFDIRFALLLAILGGILEIIPYFGPIMAGIPAIMIAFSAGPFVAGLVAVAYLTINLIENQILIPKIMNRAIGLNPVLVILALLMGAQIAGVVGLLLAVPLAGALGVFIKDVLEKKIA